MILRKVTLSNWRALEKFEMELGSGLNVLQGRNEAGKSSVVEAIDWALYRDITGARIRAEEVKALIPARDPLARPSVEVELEFPDCRATLLKILAEDSGKRECRLTLRRDGHADEHFDRTEAQKRLRALFAADGLGAEKGSIASGGLLVSHQGESADFLSDGTAAIRSTLGIGSDGSLALTSRLERTRAAVETLRKKEILQDLELSAIEVARAGTDAAKARDELKEAEYQLTHFERVTEEIEELRTQIEGLSAELGEISPQVVAAHKRLEDLGALQLAQNEADKSVLLAQGAEREAKSGLDGAKSRADEITRLTFLQSEAQRELQGSESAVEEARLLLESAQNRNEEVCELLEGGSLEAENARHSADAWRHYFAVFEAQTALGEERKAFAGLQALGTELSEAQKTRDATSKAPTFEEIRNWKNAFENWQRLESEAAQGVQLEIKVQNDLELAWKADGGTWEKHALSNGENSAFSASAEGLLKIAGVGAIKVRTGARGVGELHVEVAAAKTKLDELLLKWEVDVASLPAAFDEWEGRRSLFEAAETAWKDAAEILKREENRLGSLHEAQKRVEQREAEFKEAKEACKPFEGVIELGGKKRGEVKAALDAAVAQARDCDARANRIRNDAATAAQNLRKAETDFHQVKARPDMLRETMASRALELARLQGDGLSATARTELLDEFNQKLARARMELESAQSNRREMGDGVSQWKLEEARRSSAALADSREKIEKTLAARERDLFHACQQDARAEIERLKVLIEEKQVETARHESRLRGITLLDAVIQAERARLSRDLAGPLNEKLGPWLTQMRGKNTSLAFDEAGGKMESVLTRDGDSSISLPFAEHSEGLKEQVAFALRLLLATRVASHLPSKQLPVVLDDPFTQSDAARRDGLGEVLKDAAQTLQLLFVTCHGAPHVDGLEVNLIRLGDWDQSETAPRPTKAAKDGVKTPPKTAVKVPKKSEKKPEKIVLETEKIAEETLALF